MEKNILVSELDQSEIFCLVDLMRNCDDILEDLLNSTIGMSFEPTYFAPIKAAVLLWGRISELFGFPCNSCTYDLPAIYPSDFYSDSAYERGIMDQIADFIFNWYDIAEPDIDLLMKSGITISNESLTPDTIEECMVAVKDAALDDGEALSEDEIREKAYERLIGHVFPKASGDVTDYMVSLISYIEKFCFYASEIVYLRSKRVGRFLSNKSVLCTVLPTEVVDAVEFLIRAVFNPLYVEYPDLRYEWMNEAGEYCSIYCLGDSENSSEDSLYGIYKRPYADIAVSLLDRLLTEAETLAPDILCDSVVSVDLV